MSDKTSVFRIVFFAALGLIILIGVLVFSLQRRNASELNAPVVMWGTLDDRLVRGLVEFVNTNQELEVALNIDYTQISKEEFEPRLVEALASGEGPDLVLMSDDLLVKHENKLFNIDYQYYSQKDYKETFIEAGDVLIKDSGLSGFPLIIDPLVMYWNRSALSSASVSEPPRYWDQFIELVPRLVLRDSSFNLQRSALAFGEFRNVNYAKESLISLIMQAGNSIIVRNEVNPDSFGATDFLSIFNDRLGYPVKPSETAINYFTQFSNPTKNVYTWNRALPNDEEMFLAGDLAFYFAPASQYASLRQKNPNLNFDVAMVPQSRSSNNKKVYGDLTFLALVKNSPNLGNAFRTASILINSESVDFLSNQLNLPPVRRDLLGEQNSNAVMQIFYDSALVAEPFLDPDSSKTDQILTDLIESFVSGRSDLSDAILRANSEIVKLLE